MFGKLLHNYKRQTKKLNIPENFSKSMLSGDNSRHQTDSIYNIQQSVSEQVQKFTINPKVCSEMNRYSLNEWTFLYCTNWRYMTLKLIYLLIRPPIIWSVFVILCRYHIHRYYKRPFPNVDPLVVIDLFFMITIPILLCAYVYIYSRNYKPDKTLYSVLTPSPPYRFMKLNYTEIRVGQILCLHANDIVPADVIILSASASEIFIDVSSVEGTTQLVMRIPVKETQDRLSAKSFGALRGTVECRKTVTDEDFKGEIFMSAYPRPAKFTSVNAIPFGSKIVDVSSVFVIVSHTGMSRHVFQNLKLFSIKNSNNSFGINSYLHVFPLTLLLCFSIAVIEAVDCKRFENNKSYYNLLYVLECTNFWTSMLRIISVVSAVITYSWYWTYSLLIVIFSHQIGNDKGISNLLIDKLRHALLYIKKVSVLGKVDLIISDKTGTLTENELKLHSLSVDNTIYSIDRMSFVNNIDSNKGKDLYSDDSDVSDYDCETSSNNSFAKLTRSYTASSYFLKSTTNLSFSISKTNRLSHESLEYTKSEDFELRRYESKHFKSQLANIESNLIPSVSLSTLFPAAVKPQKTHSVSTIFRSRSFPSVFTSKECKNDQKDLSKSHHMVLKSFDDLKNILQLEKTSDSTLNELFMALALCQSAKIRLKNIYDYIGDRKLIPITSNNTEFDYRPEEVIYEKEYSSKNVGSITNLNFASIAYGTPNKIKTSESYERFKSHCPSGVWNQESFSSTMSQQYLYFGKSKDEICFLEFAAYFGYIFFKGTESELCLKVNNEHRSFKIIGVNKYSPERSLMSIVLYDVKLDRFVMYCKGSFEQVSKLLVSKQDIKKAMHLVRVFSCKGLRSFVFAMRILGLEEVKQYMKVYHEAKTDVYAPHVSFSQAALIVEKNMSFIGVTGSSSVILPHVSDTFKFFSSSGIRIWICSGDSHMLCLHVAYQAKMLDQDSKIVSALLSSSDKHIENKAKYYFDSFYNKKASKEKETSLCLVIDGQTIEILFSITSIQNLYLTMLLSSDMVIAGRCKWYQKAMLVRLIKSNVKPSPVILAVGDGLNDLAMFEASDVSVCCNHNSGNQYFYVPAKFGVSSFVGLKRLLAVYGRHINFALNYFILTGIFSLVFQIFLILLFRQNNLTYTEILFPNLSLWFVRLLIYYIPFCSMIIFDRRIPDAIAENIPYFYLVSRRNKRYKVYQTIIEIVEASVLAIILYHLSILFRPLTLTTTKTVNNFVSHTVHNLTLSVLVLRSLFENSTLSVIKLIQLISFVAYEMYVMLKFSSPMASEKFGIYKRKLKLFSFVNKKLLNNPKFVTLLYLFTISTCTYLEWLLFKLIRLSVTGDHHLEIFYLMIRYVPKVENYMIVVPMHLKEISDHLCKLAKKVFSTPLNASIWSRYLPEKVVFHLTESRLLSEKSILIITDSITQTFLASTRGILNGVVIKFGQLCKLYPSDADLKVEYLTANIPSFETLRSLKSVKNVNLENSDNSSSDESHVNIVERNVKSKEKSGFNFRHFNINGDHLMVRKYNNYLLQDFYVDNFLVILGSSFCFFHCICRIILQGVFFKYHYDWNIVQALMLFSFGVYQLLICFAISFHSLFRFRLFFFLSQIAINFGISFLYSKNVRFCLAYLDLIQDFLIIYVIYRLRPFQVFGTYMVIFITLAVRGAIVQNFFHVMLCLPYVLGYGALLLSAVFTYDLHHKQKFFFELQIQQSKNKQRELLNAILPASVVDILLSSDSLNAVINAEQANAVSVVFCDICNLQQLLTHLEPIQIADLLNCVFLNFDRCAEMWECTKVETVFGTYLFASGLNIEGSEYNLDDIDSEQINSLYAKRALEASLCMLEIVSHIRIAPNASSISQYPEIVVGIHSGRVITGIVGETKPQYAMFGDTVNTASRMKQSGKPGHVHVTDYTYSLVKNDFYKWSSRELHIKGKGMMVCYLLESIENSKYPFNSINYQYELQNTEDLLKLAQDINLSAMQQMSFRNSILENQPVSNKLYIKSEITSSVSTNRCPTVIKPTCFKKSSILLDGDRKATAESTTLLTDRKYFKKVKTKYQTDKLTLETYYFIAKYISYLTLKFKIPYLEKKYKKDYIKDPCVLLGMEHFFIIIILMLCTDTLLFQFFLQSKNNEIIILYSHFAFILFWTITWILFKYRKSKDIRFFFSTNFLNHVVQFGAFFNIIGFAILSLEEKPLLKHESWINVLRSFAKFSALVLMLHNNVGLSFTRLLFFNISVIFVLVLFFFRLETNDNFYIIYLLPSIIKMVFLALLNVYTVERLKRRTWLSQIYMETSKDKARELLHSMLPEFILNEFQTNKLQLAYRHKNMSFLFSDLQGFTKFAGEIDAIKVVDYLQKFFGAIDRKTAQLKLFKLCTIGDAYVAITNPSSDDDAWGSADEALKLIELANFIIRSVKELRCDESNTYSFNVRVGLHYGSFVGGVIGSGRIRYDIWGLDVALGNLVESSAHIQAINVSENFKQLIESNFPGRYEFVFNRLVFLEEIQMKTYTMCSIDKFTEANMGNLEKYVTKKSVFIN